MNRLTPFLLIPAFALIGAANQQREWLGGIVGGLIGLFFALLVAGLLPARVTNAIFGTGSDD
ncbi:MAG: hypothetical protein QM703_13685 [Gemmatales bacterium]